MKKQKKLKQNWELKLNVKEIELSSCAVELASSDNEEWRLLVCYAVWLL
jgi:hypothetical protein